MTEHDEVRRVAAVQMEVRTGDMEWNLRQAQRHLHALRDWRPDLVVFPESVMDGYACREPTLEALSRGAGSPEIQRVMEAAVDINTWILWTYAERSRGSIFNTAILIDRDGRIQLTYRKVHLCAEVGELDAYQRGDTFPVVDMEGLKTGVMICFDRHFPEASRTLALKGAALLLHPSATIWFKPDSTSLNTAMMRTRAYENRCFLLSVNLVNYGGGSALFGPWGNVLAMAGEGEEVLHLELDPGLRDRRPENTFELLPVRHPDLYRDDIPG